MKKLITIILTSLFFFGFSFAANLKFGDFLILYFEGIDTGLKGKVQNNGWEKINVKYTNISKNTELYQAIQKGINLGIFPNLKINLPIENEIKEKAFSTIIKNQTDISLSYSENDSIDNQRTNYAIKETISQILERNNFDTAKLNDIKEKLENEYIFGDEIKNCSSLTGCMDLVKDKYTEYYDPDHTKELFESLEGNFSGIGVYLQMIGTGKFIVAETIQGGPAQKAGIKAGDIIKKVGNHTITNNTTINDISSWVKGQDGTFVTLKIQRGEKTMDIKIKRETIYLPNVTYSVLNKGVCYMDINQFNTNTLSQFEQGLSFFQKNGCSKYIFDLRDNPGGELDTVVNMLNHFVNGGNIIIELQYSNYIQDIIANNIGSKLNDKDIIILVNKSTASASEVFAGTIRDYVKKTTLMGEQTYGKGTAQSIIQYDDGSALKYTIAKRYTGKTKTNVDGVGLKPNITLTNDEINTLLQELQKHND